MKKNGFTLMELLAVIAILAILVIIAVPNVLKTFKSSSKAAFETQTRNIFMSAQNQFMIDSFDIADETIIYASDGTKLELEGGKDLKYCVVVTDGEIQKMYVSDGKHSYSTDTQIDKENITTSQIEDVSGTDTITGIANCIGNNGPGGNGSDSNENTLLSIIFVTRQVENAITKGDEVQIGSENFYVISSDATKTTLLAKYDINTTSNSQVASEETRLNFTNTIYWTDGTGQGNIISPYDANGANCQGNPYPYVYDSNNALYTYINTYTNKISTSTGLSISGRLMTYEEANGLSPNIRKDYNNNDYWLGSVTKMCGYCNQQVLYSSTNNIKRLSTNIEIVRGEYVPEPGCCIAAVWFVDSSGEMAFFSNETTFPISSSSIRPVLEVSTLAFP